MPASQSSEDSGDGEVGATPPPPAVETAQAMQQGAGLFPAYRVNMAPESALMRRREEARLSQASCFCFWRCGL